MLTCGAVIFNKKGDVLLVEHLEGSKHVTGTFGLPAGRLEPGEKPLDGTVREVKEETGLSIDKSAFQKLPTTYQAVMERKDGFQRMSWEVFTTTTEGGVLTDSSETRPQWMSLKKLEGIKHLLVPNVYNAIQEAHSIT